MPINDTLTRLTRPGDGSATVFPFDPIQVFNPEDMKVTRFDADGVAHQLSYGADYTVQLGTPLSLPSAGQVTFAVAPTANEKVQLYRQLPFNQLIKFGDLQGYYPATQQRGFDKLTALCQELRDRIVILETDGVVITTPTPTPTTPNPTPTTPTPTPSVVSDAMLAFVGSDTMEHAVELLTMVAPIGEKDRKLTEAIGDWKSVLNAVGVDPTGASDSTAGLQFMLDHCKNVFFPSQPDGTKATYTISAPLNCHPEHFIQGAGPGAAEVLQTNAGQAVFQCIKNLDTFSTLNIGNLGMRCSGAGGFGVKAKFLHGGPKIHGVQFNGCEAGAVNFDSCYYPSAVCCDSYPTALRKAGPFDAITPATNYYNWSPLFFRCNVDSGDQTFGLLTTKGVNNHCFLLHRAITGAVVECSGSRLNYPVTNTVDGIIFEGDCQGCYIRGGVTFGAKFGVSFGSGSGSPNSQGPTYCAVVDHDIDNPSTAGIAINGNSGFPTTSCTDITVRGGHNTAVGATGVQITCSYVTRLKIQGTELTQYANAGMGQGILIDHINVGTITGNGINNYDVGIAFAGSGNQNVLVQGNQLIGNDTALTGDTTGAGFNKIRDNPGWNPNSVTITTPAFPTSGAAASVNQTGYDIQAVVAAGAATVAMLIDGVSYTTTFTGQSMTFIIPAGGTYGSTFSGGTPTWKWGAM